MVDCRHCHPPSKDPKRFDGVGSLFFPTRKGNDLSNNRGNDGNNQNQNEEKATTDIEGSGTSSKDINNNNNDNNNSNPSQSPAAVSFVKSSSVLVGDSYTSVDQRPATDQSKAKDDSAANTESNDSSVTAGNNDSVAKDASKDPDNKGPTEEKEHATTDTTDYTFVPEYMEYDNTKYEEQMFNFNTVTRVALYKHDCVGEGIDYCYDCASEVWV